MNNILIFILVFFTSMNSAFSQAKLEREYRIKDSQVPLKATEFIKNTFGTIKLKWYGEESLKGRSVEAKGSFNKKLYSIEFDTLGNLQDIEVRIDMKSIPENTRNKIKRQLETKFKAFRIHKVQAQQVADASEIKSSKGGEIISDEMITNYEIVLKGRKEKKYSFYEVLFTKDGELIRESQMIERNNHHLIY